MRLHLDTNILVFLICDNTSLSKDVLEYIFDYSNTLYTSAVCVHELIHLFQIRKISARNEKGKTLSDKATLVSSDLKFQWYSKFGLNVILNER